MPNCHPTKPGGRLWCAKLPKYFPLFLMVLALCLRLAGLPNPVSGSAPFIFEGNRIYAELAFVRPDGTLHKTLAYVDLGSPSMILSEALVKELKLDAKKPLVFNVGDTPVRIDSSTVTSDSWLPFSVAHNRKVEALLPGGVMQNYEVVIDYAHSKLTLAQPGALKPEGTPVPGRVNPKTGLIAVDVSVDGQSYPVTIDNGSAYTWLRKATVQEWLAVHTEWQRGTGAVGPSNMRMADDSIEAKGILVRIPEIKLGSLHLKQVGALAIGPSKTRWDFIDWYSQKNALPVIGWLGGNVLRSFRVTIDYPNRMTYWLPQTEADTNDLDQVGLTLSKKRNAYFVAAVATQDGKPTVEGVRVGDKLLRVGTMNTSGASLAEIFSAMHGKPGDFRTLILERENHQFTVRAKVTHF